MSSNIRSRRTGILLASLAAVMLATPTAVLAHGDSRVDRRHKSRDVASSHTDRPWSHAYRPWYRSHRPEYGNSMRTRLARSGRVHGSTRYYCKPCGHAFHSSRELRSHVHHRHHVPLWRLPFVIAHGVLHGAFAWVFYG